MPAHGTRSKSVQAVPKPVARRGRPQPGPVESRKAKAFQECCPAFVLRFGGQVPDRPEDLGRLPGVKRKTANLLRGHAVGHPAIGVDMHVLRLAQRLGFSLTTDGDTVGVDLSDLVPDEQRVRFCHLSQRHARTRCHARRPDCPACVVHRFRPYSARAGEAGG